MFIGLSAAVAAAVIFGLSAVAQAIVARRQGLISWGMFAVGVSYLLGWGLHLVAIARLPLYLAQAGVSLSLGVTALVAVIVVREPLRLRHWAAIVATVGGLSMLAFAAGAVGKRSLSAEVVWLLYGGVLAIALAAVFLIRLRGRRTGILLGVLSGLAYAGTPIASSALVSPTWSTLTYAAAFSIGLFGVLGFVLYTRGLERASITSVTAPLVLIQTVGPAAIGLIALHDQVRTGYWPVAIWSFALCLGGVLVLLGAEERVVQA